MPKIVLLVDDNIDWIQIWKRDLNKHGIEVLSAGTTKKAKEIFKENPNMISLVALDGDLDGGGNTRELAKELRSEFPWLAIVAISGNTDSQKELIEAGCNFCSPQKWEVSEYLIKLLK